MVQLEGASKGKERKAAQAELDKAQARLAKYQGRLSGAGAGEGTPRVEVGCLEEVIGKMEADTDGEWGNVMFIPKGARQIPSLLFEVTAALGQALAA